MSYESMVYMLLLDEECSLLNKSILNTNLGFLIVSLKFL